MSFGCRSIIANAKLFAFGFRFLQIKLLSLKNIIMHAGFYEYLKHIFANRGRVHGDRNHPNEFNTALKHFGQSRFFLLGVRKKCKDHHKTFTGGISLGLKNDKMFWK